MHIIKSKFDLKVFNWRRRNKFVSIVRGFAKFYTLRIYTTTSKMYCVFFGFFFKLQGHEVFSLNRFILNHLYVVGFGFHAVESLRLWEWVVLGLLGGRGVCSTSRKWNHKVDHHPDEVICFSMFSYQDFLESTLPVTEKWFWIRPYSILYSFIYVLRLYVNVFCLQAIPLHQL